MARPEEDIFELEAGDSQPSPDDINVTGEDFGANRAEEGAPEDSTGASQEPQEPVQAVTGGTNDPSAASQVNLDPYGQPGPVFDPNQTPVPQKLDPAQTHGPFDAYSALVLQVFTGSVPHPLTGYGNTIEIQRCSVHWNVQTNTPTAWRQPMASSGPTPTLASPFPFPPRHDQATFIVKVGDVVSIIQGRDGRAWYLSDELPFIGTVWAQTCPVYNSVDDLPMPNSDGDPIPAVDDMGQAGTQYYRWNGYMWAYSNIFGDSGEWHAGAAGYRSIDVRRRILETDPAAVNFEDFANHDPSLASTVNKGPDLRYTPYSTDHDDFVTYRHVWPVCSPTKHHGYRVGDRVLVFRRGQYLFCLPTEDSFLAKIVASGPDGEGDQTGAGYWVKEQESAVTYATKNDWTSVETEHIPAVPQEMPAGSRTGRHVSAWNLCDDTTHELSVGDTVLVHIFADVTTGQPMYVFERTIVDAMTPAESDAAYQIKWALVSGSPAGGAGTYTAVTTFGWTVACTKATDRAGAGGDTGAAIAVYLGQASGKYPNCRVGQVIGYLVDAHGVLVCVTDYMDDALNTVKLWSGAGASPPAGWAIESYAGKYLKVKNADGDAMTGGNATHTHADHDSHGHVLTGDSHVKAGPEIGWGTAGPVNGGGTPTALSHAAANTDPEWVVYYVIKRTD